MLPRCRTAAPPHVRSLHGEYAFFYRSANRKFPIVRNVPANFYFRSVFSSVFLRFCSASSSLAPRHRLTSIRQRKYTNEREKEAEKAKFMHVSFALFYVTRGEMLVDSSSLSLICLALAISASRPHLFVTNLYARKFHFVAEPTYFPVHLSFARQICAFISPKRTNDGLSSHRMFVYGALILIE